MTKVRFVQVSASVIADNDDGRDGCYAVDADGIWRFSPYECEWKLIDSPDEPEGEPPP